MQYLAPILNDQQVDVNGDPLSGGLVEVYVAGTSTPAPTTSDRAGAVPNTWPIVLNVLGVNSQGAVWVAGGQNYKFVIKDVNGVVQRILDNVQGMNDSATSFDQWVLYQNAPTFISATSFSVGGDQTLTFQVGRRVRTVNSGGIVYSTILNSVFASGVTTVTLANDSSVLDTGLSQVFYGLVSSENSSLPGSGAWSSQFVPITTSIGSLSNADAQLRFSRNGKTIFFKVIATIINNGTGAGIVRVQLPWSAFTESAFAGRESQSTGFTVGATMASGSPLLNILRYDNTYPGGNNYRIVVGGILEVA